MCGRRIDEGKTADNFKSFVEHPVGHIQVNHPHLDGCLQLFYDFLLCRLTAAVPEESQITGDNLNGK